MGLKTPILRSVDIAATFAGRIIMSKYEPLWKWIRENRADSFKLTFDGTGFPSLSYGCTEDRE
jgi:hypothetical protein